MPRMRKGGSRGLDDKKSGNSGEPVAGLRLDFSSSCLRIRGMVISVASY
jgi:hypothetical protein